MSRLFWFTAGAVSTVVVQRKAQEYYRRLTPAGMTEQIERRVEEGSDRARAWWADFADTYQRARATKQSELMAVLTHDERGQLE